MAASALQHMPLRVVFLTGFMGSGKTAVGRALAQRLRWRFADLDESIEQQGRAVAAIFAVEGEAAFRRVESLALERLLASHAGESLVAALGGGTLGIKQNRARLRFPGSTVILLEAPAEVLWQRCRAQQSERPLLKDELSFRRLYAVRRTHYAGADAVIETGVRSVDQVAEEIERWMLARLSQQA